VTIRTLVVDDESVARRGIRQHLRSESDIEIIGECDDGATAVASITELQPDLVFLDLQMPELGGFDVIESVGLGRMPAVIFVTAFDQFAVRAFDVHALDYVLKPIEGERFARALQRARQHLSRPADQLGQSIAAALKELDRAALRSWSRRLAIRSAGRIVLVEVRDIDRCEAAGNYVEVHVGAKAHLVRETMTSLESRLDPQQFVRISRSSIVNIERVRELHPMFSGDFVAVMADGARIIGSRRFRETLDALLR
jgi:two-component system, LytTR family, response regulator